CRRYRFVAADRCFRRRAPCASRRNYPPCYRRPSTPGSSGLRRRVILAAFPYLDKAVAAVGAVAIQSVKIGVLTLQEADDRRRGQGVVLYASSAESRAMIAKRSDNSTSATLCTTLASMQLPAPSGRSRVAHAPASIVTRQPRSSAARAVELTHMCVMKP